MIEQRQVRVKLLAMGKYSKVLILPRWWLKLNNDPEAVDLSLTFGFIGIQPVEKEQPRKEEVGSGKQH